MSSVSPYFFMMPARWPISGTDESQLPRWPGATFMVSCASAPCAMIAAASSVPVAARRRPILPNIVSTPVYALPRGSRYVNSLGYSDAKSQRLLGCDLARGVAMRARQLPPVRALGHDALEGAQPHPLFMREV